MTAAIPEKRRMSGSSLSGGFGRGQDGWSGRSVGRACAARNRGVTQEAIRISVGVSAQAPDVAAIDTRSLLRSER